MVIGPLPLNIPLLREREEGGRSLRPRRRHVGSVTLLWALPNAAAYGPSGTFRSCGRRCTLPPTARRAAAVRLQEITKV